MHIRRCACQRSGNWLMPVPLLWEIEYMIIDTSCYPTNLVDLAWRHDGEDRKSTRLNSSHTEIYTLSLHALFRSQLVNASSSVMGDRVHDHRHKLLPDQPGRPRLAPRRRRSEEHTSELQSHRDLHSFPTRALPISTG